MKEEMTVESHREGTAPTRRAADRRVRRARRRFLPVYLVWAVLLPVGLVQGWFAFARRSIAYELPKIENQTRLVQSEIEKYHIEAESLKALSRVALLAQELGFDKPTVPPIVLPPTVREVASGGVALQPNAVTAGASEGASESDSEPATQGASMLPAHLPLAHRTTETETVRESH